MDDVVLLNCGVTEPAQDCHRNYRCGDRGREREPCFESEIHIRRGEHQRDNDADNEPAYREFFAHRTRRIVCNHRRGQGIAINTADWPLTQRRMERLGTETWPVKPRGQRSSAAGSSRETTSVKLPAGSRNCDFESRRSLNCVLQCPDALAHSLNLLQNVDDR